MWVKHKCYSLNTLFHMIWSKMMPPSPLAVKIDDEENLQ